MSAYFQRLIQQSGLHVQEPLVAPAPASGLYTPSPSSVQNETTSVPSLEVHEEHLTALASPLAPATTPGSLPTRAAHPPTSAPSPDNHPRPSPPHQPALNNPPPEIIALSQRVQVNSPQLAHDATPPRTHVATANTPPVAGASEVITQMESFSAKEGIPAGVMQAVMRWISAGQPQTGTTAPQNLPEPQDRHDQAQIAVQTDPASTHKNLPAAAPKIPERVIEIVEEYFESSSPPAPAKAVAARPAPSPQHGPAPVPASASSAAPSDPVQVSIGSINVRIEAPVSTPVPVRASRAEPARNSTPARASHFSKLRRHYILPH